MKILDLQTIKDHIDEVDVLSAVEKGFVEYSNGSANVPPVGHLVLPDGDCHIKYGHISGDPLFIIKVASGFHNNPQKGLNASTGLMLLCSAETGAPIALLQDEGHLTDIRTAVAGAIAGKYLSVADLGSIGIVGAGVQAELQLQWANIVSPCHKALIWNRTPARAHELREKFATSDIEVSVVQDIEELVVRSKHIITTTPSTSPLISSEWVQPGTHITAVGADCPGKQELDATLVQRADVLVVDSVSQCVGQGEVQTALAQDLIVETDLMELGHIVGGGTGGRRNDKQISIADLTGVAVQDIAIAGSVYAAWLDSHSN